MSNRDDKPIALPPSSITSEPPRVASDNRDAQDAAADKLRERQERDEAEQRALEDFVSEQSMVRTIDEDTEAQRAATTSNLVRGGALGASGVMVGFAVGGPLGGLMGGLIGAGLNYWMER